MPSLVVDGAKYAEGLMKLALLDAAEVVVVDRRRAGSTWGTQAARPSSGTAPRHRLAAVRGMVALQAP